MTPENFIYWLKGFIADRDSLDTARLKAIQSMIDTIQPETLTFPGMPWIQPNLPSYPNPNDWKVDTICQASC